jgi:hypothetical protein
LSIILLKVFGGEKVIPATLVVGLVAMKLTNQGKCDPGNVFAHPFVGKKACADIPMPALTGNLCC